MIHFKRRGLLSAVLITALAVAVPAMAQSSAKPGKIQAVLQVSDNDPQKWNLALTSGRD